MRISTEIHSIARIAGMERAIELVAAAGFDCWDLSMFDMAKLDRETLRVMDNDHPLHSSDYAAFVKRLRLVGEDCGITCNQAHAPYPSRGREMMDYLKRAIECTAEAGGKICIIHPDNNKSAQENAEMYHALLDFAKPMGVKIATENMFNWDSVKDVSSPAACSSCEDFVAHLETVRDDSLVACLDIGHAEMRNGAGPGAVNLVRALGHHLQALHIHDNDGRLDSHQLPFTMTIDYAPIVKAMKEIGYAGYFTLEADTYLGKFTADTVYEGIQNMAAAAKRLADMFENA